MYKKRTTNKRHVKVWIFSLLLSAVFLTSLSCRAEEVNIEEAIEVTLEQAIQEALDNSPEVSISRERIYQAKQALLVARGDILPQVKFTASGGRTFKDKANHRSDNDPAGSTGYMDTTDTMIKVSQHLFDGFATTSEIKKKETEYLISLENATIIYSDISKQIVQAYIDIYKNQLTLTEIDILSERLRKLKTKMDILLEEGRASKTMQKYISARIKRTEQARVQSKNSFQNAIESYHFITNKRLDPNLTKVSMPLLTSLKDFEYYKERLMQENPEILSSEKQKETIELDLKKAYGSLFPSFNLIGEFNETNDSGGKVGSIRNGSLMVSLKYDLYDGGKKAATRRKIKSQLTEQEYAITRTKRDLTQKLLSLWQEIKAREDELALVKSEVADNRIVRDLRKQEFEEGDGDLVTLVEEEENLFKSISNEIALTSLIVKKRLELELMFGEIEMDKIVEQVGLAPIPVKEEQPQQASLSTSTQPEETVVSDELFGPFPLLFPQEKTAALTEAKQPIQQMAEEQVATDSPKDDSENLKEETSFNLESEVKPESKIKPEADSANSQQEAATQTASEPIAEPAQQQTTAENIGSTPVQEPMDTTAETEQLATETAVEEASEPQGIISSNAQQPQENIPEQANLSQDNANVTEQVNVIEDTQVIETITQAEELPIIPTSYRQPSRIRLDDVSGRVDDILFSLSER